MSQIAAKNDVPCVILRAMSDNADEDGHEVLVVKKFSIAEYVATATRIVAAWWKHSEQPERPLQKLLQFQPVLFLQIL